MNGARSIGSKPRQAGRSWFGARWLRIAASALAVVSGAKATSALAEGQVDYRSGVRPSWVEFASRLQQQFQRELAVDNESTARFYDAMNRISLERSGQASDPPPSALVVAHGSPPAARSSGSSSRAATAAMRCMISMPC
jgi:hypothetical protein